MKKQSCIFSRSGDRRMESLTSRRKSDIPKSIVRVRARALFPKNNAQ